MKTDVIIIGGGIVGCAAAYYLARHGVHVLVLEKNPGVGLEASGRNGGGVRQHGRKAALPLAMESVKLWTTLAEELDADLEYAHTGNLKIATDEAAAEGYEREMRVEHEKGLQDVRLLTATECHTIFPGIAGRVVLGKYCASDGIANPMLVAPAFAKAGRKLGAQFRMNTSVTGLLKQGDTICGVKTASGEIESKVVINSAGPWAAPINAEGGCPIKIGPGRSQLMVTARLTRSVIKHWVTISGLGYMRPNQSGNLVLGSAGARNDQYSYHFDYFTAAIQSKRWCKFFPWMKDLTIIRAFAGITEYTPDGEPYIGAVPGAPGLYVAAGFHGEGFCLGPIVGKLLSQLIVTGESYIPLDPFRPDRFTAQILAGRPLPPITYPLDKMLSHIAVE